MDIILASASPRRAQLLTQLGLTFTVRAAEINEDAVTAETPAALVETLARQKGEAVLAAAPQGSLVIAADTVVVLDGEILGKPRDEQEAVAMLTRLSGRLHTVYTGLAVLVSGDAARCAVTHEAAAVRFRALTEREILRYVQTGEPLDKAGAYGIQEYGATLVERVEGDYFAVVGLPLCRLTVVLSELGYDNLIL